jgi:hypothetical protein
MLTASTLEVGILTMDLGRKNIINEVPQEVVIE